MIMVIGLGLAPSAIGQIGLNGADFDLKVVTVALVSFLTTAIVMTRAKGFLKVIPFLIGIGTGYLLACAFGMIDFTPVKEAAWLSVPKFQFPFVHYKLEFAALITIAPIALVTMAEHIGDHTALSAIIGKDLLKEPGLDRTLLGDGIATFVAGLLGGPANTTYGENTSVVGLTKVASVWVIGLAAILAICLGFLGKFTALVSTIPNPVLGGVSLILYGFIAVNGLKVLIQNQTDFSNSKNVVVASTMLVLGLGGAAVSIVHGDLSVTISGMSLAAVIGILLNLFIPADKEAVKETVAANDEKYIQRSELKTIKNEIKTEIKAELKNELNNELKQDNSKNSKPKNEKNKEDSKPNKAEKKK
jgi:uracil permease